jgi:surface protein
MSGMFSYCRSLTTLDLSNFDTSNVTNMGFMFESCVSLTSLDVSNFDTSSVTNMGFMFFACESLITLNVSNFDTSNVTATAGMFAGCSSLTTLDLKNFDMSNVTDASQVFFWEATYGAQMFNDCVSLSTIYAPKNVVCEVSLPANEDSPWKLSDGTVVTALPQNLSKSVKITRKPQFTEYNTAIRLSATSYTYTGKAQKPTVTVKDSKGNEISSKYYTVSYKNNKKVGTATVTITFKDKYAGTIKETYEIVPKATTISKLTSLKTKAFTIKWKKQATQTTGYEIQYSTSSKFTTKTTKTVTVKSAKTTSKTISKLSVRKKYYVRIRTYKAVNGTKYYSSWSMTLSVKTK